MNPHWWKAAGFCDNSWRTVQLSKNKAALFESGVLSLPEFLMFLYPHFWLWIILHWCCCLAFWQHHHTWSKQGLCAITANNTTDVGSTAITTKTHSKYRGQDLRVLSSYSLKGNKLKKNISRQLNLRLNNL